jgi:hypothetical protein
MYDIQGEGIMAKTLRSNPVTRKLGLLTVAAGLFVAAAIGVPRPAHACQMWTDYFTYFSDASKTTQVGWCEFDCYCVTYCEGTRTQYYNHSSWAGCL